MEILKYVNFFVDNEWKFNNEEIHYSKHLNNLLDKYRTRNDLDTPWQSGIRLLALV